MILVICGLFLLIIDLSILNSFIRVHFNSEIISFIGGIIPGLMIGKGTYDITHKRKI